MGKPLRIVVAVVLTPLTVTWDFMLVLLETISGDVPGTALPWLLSPKVWIWASR